MASKRSALCGLVLGISGGLAAPALAADPPVDTLKPPATASCEGTPKSVEFGKGSAKLSSDAKSVLAEVVVWAKATPDRSLQLRAPEGNKATAKLNQRRVAAVKSYLSQNGIEPDKMMALDAAPASDSAAAGTSGSTATATSANAIEVATCGGSTTASTSATGSSTTGSTAGLSERKVPAVPSVPGDSAALPTTPAPVPPTAVDSPSALGSSTPATPATPSMNLDRTASGAPTMTTPPVDSANPQLPPPPPPPFNPAMNTAPPQTPSYAADNGSDNNNRGGQYRPRSRIGVETTIGGGVVGFVDENARAFTEPGGQWETRVAAGTREYLAVETAYIGSAQNINALGLGSDARLVGNGLEGDLRLNLTKQMVQPYLFGGVGWDHYKLSMNGTNTSSLRDSDDVLTVPFGLGLAFRLAPGFMFDVRGTARAAFYDDLMDGPYAASGQDARLHTWNVGGRLGWEF